MTVKYREFSYNKGMVILYYNGLLHYKAWLTVFTLLWNTFNARKLVIRVVFRLSK